MMSHGRSHILSHLSNYRITCGGNRNRKEKTSYDSHPGILSYNPISLPDPFSRRQRGLESCTNIVKVLIRGRGRVGCRQQMRRRSSQGKKVSSSLLLLVSDLSLDYDLKRLLSCVRL